MATTNVNFTIPDFTGDTGTGGEHGLVPAPAAGDATKALKGDGTWDTVINTISEDVGPGVGLVDRATAGAVVLKNAKDGQGTRVQANTGSFQTDVHFSAANLYHYSDALGEPLEGSITAAGRAILDDATAADQRTTLGVPAGSGTSTGSNTGDQDLSGYQTISALAGSVRAVVLTGLSLATSQVIAATDTVLQAFGYLQAQITALTTTVGGKLTAASNLSDLASAGTARTNLGLGTAAMADLGAAAGNALAVNTINAKGDLIVGTADNAATALTVGTNGMGLFADSSAAGGMAWGFQPYILTWFRVSTTITDIPVAVEWLSGAANLALRNTLFDLASFRQIRMMTYVTTAGNAGSKILFRYRTSFSATASAYSAIGTSEVFNSLTTGGGIWVDSGWIDLAAGARADNIYIGLFTLDGNGTADPVVNQCNMYLR